MIRFMLEDTVVRHEFFGPLIWGGKLGAYFLPKNDRIKYKFLKILEKKKYQLNWKEGLEADLLKDLLKLGIDGNIKEIISPYKKRLSGPLEMYFDYTWLCNLAKEKCGKNGYCYARKFLGPTTMRTDKVKDLIHEMYEWGVMRLHLAGGEPTINKKAFANYLDSARSVGILSSMATNGILFDKEIVEIILRNQLKSVSFSVDGPDEESYARIRGTGLFDKTIKGIKLMIKMREETYSETRVCLKPTYDVNTEHTTLERLVKLAIDLGIDVIKFANPERCLHHERGYYSKGVEKYYATIFFIKELQQKYGDQITITNISNPIAGCGEIGLPGFHGCIGAQELLAINPNGNITPCLMHSYNLGNVLTEYKSLRDFWGSSKKLPDFWAALAKLQSCKSCDIYNTCRSGSITRRIVQKAKFNEDRTTGQFEGTKDPLCPKDYINKHPNVTLNTAVDDGGLKYFNVVNVRHSL